MINLIWAIAVVLLAVLSFCVFKGILNFKKATEEAKWEHELDLKKEAFENEQFWHFQKNLERDFTKELTDKISEGEKKLKEEKENREKTLAQERLKAEHDFYEKILRTFYAGQDQKEVQKQ